MILLNKKRIILFLLFIFLSIIVYYICLNDSVNGKTVAVSNMKNEALITSNMDSDKKTIIVDAGHRSPRLWRRGQEWRYRG